MKIWSEDSFRSFPGTLGTRGFSRVRREFSVLAEGRHVFGRRPKPREKAFRAGHYEDLTETGNRARKVSGTQGNHNHHPSKQPKLYSEGLLKREIIAKYLIHLISNTLHLLEEF